MQTRVFANQLSAAVWPYLSFSFTTSNGMVKCTLDNDGLGPAVLRSVALTVDGQAKPTISAALKTIKVQPDHSTVSMSSVGAGEVIRPSASITVVEYRGPHARDLSALIRKRVKLTVCYCSLLDQCWSLATSTSLAASPQQIEKCPAPASVDA